MNRPADLVEQLITYIRAEMRGIESPLGYDARRIYDTYSQAKANLAAFLAAVAHAVLPARGARLT